MSSLNSIARMGVVLILFGAGCATTTLKVPDTVGPAPQSPPTEGELVVFTDIFYRDMPDLANDTRKPYDLLDARGGKIQTVSSSDTEPPIITLKAGNYIVRGPGLGKLIEIPVRIVAGRTTEVHLDRAAPPVQERSRLAVYGPDGSFVGWRATPSK
jgi:hypothetical protein